MAKKPIAVSEDVDVAALHEHPHPRYLHKPDADARLVETIEACEAARRDGWRLRPDQEWTT